MKKHEWTSYDIPEGETKGSYTEREVSWCCNCGCLREWELCGKTVISIYFPVGSKPGRDSGVLDLPECKTA